MYNLDVYIRNTDNALGSLKQLYKKIGNCLPKANTPNIYLAKLHFIDTMKCIASKNLDCLQVRN